MLNTLLGAWSWLRVYARAVWIGARLMLTGKAPVPRTVSIDPLSACNLKCPLCPTGAGLAGKGKMMSFECFQRLVEKMPFIHTLVLFKWGEPLLHPQILEMIRYAARRGIKTVISTNFSFRKDDEFFTGLVESGLTTLIVSLDGASQESYAHYRVGGNFDLVYANMAKLAARRSELGRQGPQIIWQFLVSRFNEHEIAKAKEMAQQVGVKLDLGSMGLADDLPDVRFPGNIEERKAHWLPREHNEFVAEHYRREYRFPLEEKVCRQIYKTLIVNPDGQVLPCCHANDPKSTFGDLTQKSFQEIWSSDQYRESRLLSLGRPVSQEAKSVCWPCSKFTKNPTWSQRWELFVSMARTEEEALRTPAISLLPEA